MLFFNCLHDVSVLWLFLSVSLISLQCVIVVFPDHTHFLTHCEIYSWSLNIFEEESMLFSGNKTNLHIFPLKFWFYLIMILP